MPVSSSAQLTLLPWLLGWDEPPHRTTWAAALHAGSCAGVLWALRRDLCALTPAEVATVGLSSVPAAVAGYLGADAVEARLGTRPQLAGLLAGAGVLLWAADRRPADRPLTGASAGAAALAQVVALAPGVSRSGATLTALRLLRVERREAQRFSLLMSLPITAGAAALTLARSDPGELHQVAPGLAAGVPVAALTAAAATAAVRRRAGAPVRLSALYRLAVAAATGIAAVRRSREHR